MPYRISRDRFGEIAERIYEKLPAEFRERFHNMTIVIEDYPSAEDMQMTGASYGKLLGLFRGVGYPNRDSFFGLYPLPDEIILFQKNIESICNTEKELLEEIRLTLIHEIGHYFGMSEEDLDQYE